MSEAVDECVYTFLYVYIYKCYFPLNTDLLVQ